jgi:hypothetical protein
VCLHKDRKGNTVMQRGLNDLERPKLSCGRIIWLHAHPLPSLSRQQVASLIFRSSYVSPVELTDGRGGGGGGGAKSYDRKKA